MIGCKKSNTSRGANPSWLKTLEALIKIVPIMALIACSQGVNWREISVGETSARAWLPCKPSSVERALPVGESAGSPQVRVNMTGCELGGRLFGISYIKLGDLKALGGSGQGSNDPLELWRRASLSAAGVNQAITSENWNKINSDQVKRATTLKVKTPQDMDVQFVWILSQEFIFQLAVYSPKSLQQSGEAASLIAQFQESFQIK